MEYPHPSVHEELRGLTLVSLSMATFTIATLLVCLRMYVRMTRCITGWDDHLICVAVVSI